MKDEKKVRKRDSGGIAVGAYLKVLREDMGMSPTEVAALIKTDATQVWRIESWKADVRSSLLFAYIKAVKARPDDVARLINDPDAGVGTGETLARLLIASR